MRRIWLMMSMALMLAAAMALSGVAQAASPTAKCKQEASNLGLNPFGYKFIAGSDKKNDNFTSKATAGKDVFCGFGGNDQIGTLDAGDIFIGGAGQGSVNSTNNGTFNEDAGDDYVVYPESSTGIFVQ